MRIYLAAIAIALAAVTGCAAAPPPLGETGPDFGPDPGTEEHVEACYVAPERNHSCPGS